MGFGGRVPLSVRDVCACSGRGGANPNVHFGPIPRERCRGAEGPKIVDPDDSSFRAPSFVGLLGVAPPTSHAPETRRTSGLAKPTSILPRRLARVLVGTFEEGTGAAGRVSG